ncbi:MAG: CHAT domain-containing protein [Spirulinaceae cyanobacterium]
MSSGFTPSLSLAIARLTQAGSENFAIWILKAPFPGGYVHHDCIWSEELTQKWLAWQEMFSIEGDPHLPFPLEPNSTLPSSSELDISNGDSSQGYGSRLMQDFGINLWQWLFKGLIRNSLAQSQGIAIGQNKPLRLRLEMRDPNLISLPWEIMQPEAGKQAISLNQQLLFSRTTNDVDPLKRYPAQEELNILLVLGHDEQKHEQFNSLKLEQEAATLAKVVEQQNQLQPDLNKFVYPVPACVDSLIQPTPATLIEALETEKYNVLIYAGHCVPAPDGGLLFLRPDATINGTELAQVLVRNKVTLAVFNACWGAQPDRIGKLAIKRSSLAEVLIHHGVPAVLGMRDPIADDEALSFIQALAESLCERMAIDQAVAVARQQLLTLYKFNQPAWTLPILYMHPEFDGKLIKAVDEGITELPVMPTSSKSPSQPKLVASIHSVDNVSQVWYIRGGLMRVGRRRENDLVIQEKWVSQNHAQIICREIFAGQDLEKNYFLRDFSRYGTFLSTPQGWQRIHHQEVALNSGVQIKFGSTYGQALEFVVKSS